MNSIPKPALRRRSNRSRSSEEKGGYVFGDWGFELGKMEACLARLEASLATPDQKPVISPNKPLTDGLTFRKSVPRYPLQHRPKYAATKP